MDFVKELVPGYVEYNLRGHTDFTAFFSGLRGENLRDQAQDLWTNRRISISALRQNITGDCYDQHYGEPDPKTRAGASVLKHD